MAKENALNKKLKLSPELEKFMGQNEASRAEVTKKLWDYIKSNNLQDAKDKRVICPDAQLSVLLGKDPINMMKMTGVINKHFVK